MQTLSQKDFLAKYGPDATLSLSGLTPPAPAAEPGYVDRVANKVGPDLNQRADQVGQILNRPDSNLFEKGAQLIGAGAGAAARTLETAVEEIPGVSTVNHAIGKGISALSQTAPIKAIGDVVSDSKFLQDATHAYDTDPNFKDTVNGVANLFRLGADVDTAGGMADTAGALASKAGTATRAAASDAAQGIKVPTLASNVAKDVTPTLDRVVNHNVTRALDLTQGDVKNIHLSTGNEPGQFLAKNNLIGNNVKDTTANLKTFFDTNYKQVRSEIAKDPKEYGTNQIPAYKEGLSALQRQISDVPGLHAENFEVEALLNKPRVTLNDVQRVKELMDEHFSLYKATGDVKEGVSKAGLSNLRSELQKFIETRVQKATGADIRSLNNNVSTSRSIMHAIEERSSRGLTRSHFTLGDYGAFGAGFAVGGPAGAALFVIAKKVAQSPSFALTLAKWLDGLSDAQRLKITTEMKAGQLPKELEEFYSKSSSTSNADVNQYNGVTTNLTKNSSIGDSLPQKSAPPAAAPVSVSSPKPTTLLEKAKGVFNTIREKGNRGHIKNPFAKRVPNIHPDDLHVMHQFIDHARIKAHLSDAAFAEAEKLAERFGISMDKGIGGVAKSFEDVLNGKLDVPDTVVQPRDDKGRFKGLK